VFVQRRSAPQPADDATKVSAKVLAEQLGIVSDRWSMGSCGSWPPGCPGGTCPNATVPGRPAMSGSAAGRPTAPGSDSWLMPDPLRCRRRGRLGGGGCHHRARPSARRRGPKRGPGSYQGSAAEAGQALGRSRGGLTTKVHLACDGRGRPLAMRAPSAIRVPRAVRPATGQGSPGRSGWPATGRRSGALPAATWSNEPSPASSSTGPSPPATTSWPSATTPGWSWPPCCCGSPHEPSDRP
jgi:hypothetical protein